MPNRLGVFPGVPAVEIQVGLLASIENEPKQDSAEQRSIGPYVPTPALTGTPPTNTRQTGNGT